MAIAIRINQNWCKHCMLCVKTCPKTVYETGRNQMVIIAHREGCINCGLCQLICPELAIELEEKE